MQSILLVTDYNGVAGVIAALVTNDIVNAIAENIGRFALALVAPLSSKQY